jgi:hypothetical protein
MAPQPINAGRDNPAGTSRADPPRECRHLRSGADADLVCLDEQHRVRNVMARGRWMVQHGTPLRPGLFEGHFEIPASVD